MSLSFFRSADTIRGDRGAAPITYAPEIWRDLFVMVGSSAASLIGLLFVVMSLYFNAIRQGPDYAMGATVHAARNNTFHLLTVLITAALVLAPQPARLLGLELIALHLFGLRLPILFTYNHFVVHHGGFPIAMTITIATGYLMGVAGGAAMIWRPGWALYLIGAACMTLLVRTVLTAWLLMFERRRLDGDAAAR